MLLTSAAGRADEGVHVAVVGGFGLAQGLFGGHIELKKKETA